MKKLIAVLLGLATVVALAAPAEAGYYGRRRGRIRFGYSGPGGSIGVGIPVGRRRHYRRGRRRTYINGVRAPRWSTWGYGAPPVYVVPRRVKLTDIYGHDTGGYGYRYNYNGDCY